MATIITVPHRTNAGGISPKRLRTFSERNSISLDFFFSIENKTTKHSIGCHKFMIVKSEKDNK